ncbi:MAG: hypothetical protein KBG28_00400 [Kofleriaceae bacterium]|jgi:hypothetical protein|nr:hypothetical protein [Kofleriaceae bacterium]MBP6838187.1 hypothetical protein [Kofleriaceae bacterium]MBP9202408.1 hypothetical protein [Kofleriaceae bacterium]
MRPVLLAATAIAALTLPTSTPALAGPGDDRWLMAVGVEGGGWDSAYQGGGREGPSVGLHLGLARALGAIHLGGEYEAMIIADGEGELHRFGATARVQGGLIDRQLGVGMGAYLELGAGHATALWERGGRLARRDLRLGTGMVMEIGQRHTTGFELGMVLTAAAPPPMDPDATHDLSLLLRLAVIHGR